MPVAVEVLIERLWPGRATSVTPLTNGITNANYLVDLGEDRVVVRVPGKDTRLLGIDRRREVEIGRLAAAVGVGPEVVAYDEASSCIVTRYITARPISPEELAAEPVLSAFVAALKRVHAAGEVPAVFDPYRVVRAYRDEARARGVEAPFDLDAALALADRIEAARPFRTTVLGHNDLLNANFLFDGTVRIVDWEYAGMTDPFFDLANVAVNNSFSVEAERALLDLYVGRADEALMATLHLMKVISELREAMWGVLQLAISDLDVDFAQYARDHAARIDELTRAADLDALLESAATVRDL
ncbi:MAG: phosphotransferase family protein [Acidobacteriota bacterium]|nr:phosphotransferase family protein [Acidobacteriota bacterium]